jgi:hypothetical protein
MLNGGCLMLDLRPTDRPWNETEPGDVLVLVDGYEDLLAALRRRKEALGFTHEEIDERTGLARTSFDKHFGPRRKLNLGPLSWPLYLAALGLKIALVVDNNPSPIVPKQRIHDRSYWRPGDELPSEIAS